MTKLKLLADSNIPGLDAACAGWADIRRKEGRQICAADLSDIDILLVRSVTRVDQALLANSKVAFVGSATIGVDHIDTDYLKERDIAFAYAPGCNANAVVDYVMSTLLYTFDNMQLALKTVGIAGFGNVGSRLARCLEHFGIHHRVYDPLLTCDMPNRVDSLDDILCCDVVSFHVPLTRAGEWPTHHMLAEQTLLKVKSDALLINTSRGSVIDNDALKRFVIAKPDARLALDVWESEPTIDYALYQRCAIATPHIAGYSRAGKFNGTAAIVQAAVSYFAIKETSVDRLLPVHRLTDFTSLADYREALVKVYDASSDHRRFSDTLGKIAPGADELAALFDAYRRQYDEHTFRRQEIDYSAQQD